MVIGSLYSARTRQSNSVVGTLRNSIFKGLKLWIGISHHANRIFINSIHSSDGSIQGDHWWVVSLYNSIDRVHTNSFSMIDDRCTICYAVWKMGNSLNLLSSGYKESSCGDICLVEINTIFNNRWISWIHRTNANDSWYQSCRTMISWWSQCEVCKWRFIRTWTNEWLDRSIRLISCFKCLEQMMMIRCLIEWAWIDSVKQAAKRLTTITVVQFLLLPIKSLPASVFF